MLLKGLRKKESEFNETKLSRVKLNRAQKPFVESKKRITAFIAANKIGKTTAGVFKMAPIALEGGKVCRIVGSLGFERGVRDTIYPELMKWFPPSRILKQKPNSQGIITRINILGYNGKESVISFMSGDQDDMAFEGDITDAVWIDEPCKKAIYTACLRSLLVKNGPLFFTLTPLSEPWIYNEIFLSNDPEIEVFQGSIYDALIENGGHLSKDAVDSFVSKIPESERDSRVYGKFKHLIGRVYESYKPEIHRVPKFQIPKSWPVWCAIDPHMRKPNAALFLTVSPDEEWFVCNEIYWNAGIEDFGKEVLQVASQYNMVAFLIDSSAQTTDWEKKETARSRLAKVGLSTRLARKKNQKDSAIHIVKQALEGKNESKKPWLYIFDTCRRTHFEFMNYVWDENKNPDTDGVSEKVKKVNDEMMDCLHYIVVERPRHSIPRIITLGLNKDD